MRRSEARVALEAARDWHHRGMFKQGAFEQLKRELGPIAAEGSPGLAMQALYSVGGLMLGAATAALFGLLRLNEVIGDTEGTAWLFFALFAVLLLGVGVVLLFVGQQDLGDALLLAGVVPAAITLGPQPPTDALWMLPALVGLGLVFGRHRGYVLPVVGLALTLVTLPVALFRSLQEEPASIWWLLGAVSAWAGVLTWNRIRAPSWSDEAAAATTLAVAGAWLGFTFTVIEPSFDAGYEVVLGLALLVLLAVGILTRQRGVVFASAAALTVDAIVFAFDIGGPTTGLVVLLALAVGLITTATLLRRRRTRTQTASTPPRLQGP